MCSRENRNSTIGKTHTKETKDKLSKFFTGYKRKLRTKEHRKNLSKTLTGRNLSKEHIDKIRLSNIKVDRSWMCGPSNPAWKGGISIEPYCEQWTDKDYKTSIKKRDGYICINPECSKISNILNIHHIDYNKKNCHHLNLITLCVSCNAKANKQRRWHKHWYEAIIYNRYIRGYKSNDTIERTVPLYS